MSTISPTTDTALTADDLAAFRAADVIVAHRSPEGEDYIKLTKRVRISTRGFGDNEHEVEHKVRCDGTRITYSGGNGHGAWCSSVDLHANMHDSAWNGPRQVMRAGDELHLTWVAGNNSECLNDRGLAQDELWLTIARKSKRTGQLSDGQTFRFLIDVRVTPAHSTARMCGGF